MLHTAPRHPNPTPAPFGCPDIYYELVRTLRVALPPPPGNGPEDVARRDRAAIARVAALVPANAAEAELAAQFVAASEQWKECLRLAQLPDTAPQLAAKCRVQALAMMRQANAALRLLLRLQDRHGKLDADNTAHDRAAWTEHCALGFMAEALAAQPKQPSIAEAPARSSSPPPLAGGGRGEGFRAAGAAPDPAPELIAAAERYAAAYPERAAQIRRTGKLPRDVRYFEPPEARLAHTLIVGRTPALVALDQAPEPGTG